MTNQPIHIVMTPVRNEAWVLRAFLTATSQWADYIIIADQMSTDGSREIYKEFQSAFASSSASVSEYHCELIVIDNKNPDFNEAERQAMLVAKAREIAAGRDTFLWGLDADEILAANAFKTQDWRNILASPKGAIVFFRWANIRPDKHHYQISTTFPWCFHDDGVEPHGNYVRDMHSCRIPYPLAEEYIYEVTEFFVLHLGAVPVVRCNAKQRFYTMVDWELHRRSVVILYRTMHRAPSKEPEYELSKEMLDFEWLSGKDFWSLVDTEETHTWFDDYTYEHLQRYPQKMVSRLYLWEEAFLQLFQIQDPRSWWEKFLHFYLESTKPISKTLPVRAIDKLLKKII